VQRKRCWELEKEKATEKKRTTSRKNQRRKALDKEDKLREGIAENRTAPAQGHLPENTFGNPFSLKRSRHQGSLNSTAGGRVNTQKRERAGKVILLTRQSTVPVGKKKKSTK